MAKRWKYSGDINLEEGGLFWREDGASDYVLAVRVTPCSDAGGPNNMFWIETGSIYLSNDKAKHKQALDCCGWVKDDATLTKTQRRAQLVESMCAYAGVEPDSMGAHTTVQIGKPEEARHGWNPDTRVDVQLRGGSSLQNYVRKNHLS